MEQIKNVKPVSKREKSKNWRRKWEYNKQQM